MINMSTNEQINPLIPQENKIRKTRIQIYCENCFPACWPGCLKVAAMIIIILTSATVIGFLLFSLVGFITIKIFGMDTQTNGFSEYLLFCVFIGTPATLALIMGILGLVAIGVSVYFAVASIKYCCSYETIETPNNPV
jgi:hypothetical protein